MALSTTCFERQTALTFIDVSFDYFSRKFIFSKKIIQTYLSLVEDKVSNVRLQFSMIAKKAARVTGNNTEVREKLTNTLVALQNDTDKDIKKYANVAYQVLAESHAQDEGEEELRERREKELVEREKKVK